MQIFPRHLHRLSLLIKELCKPLYPIPTHIKPNLEKLRDTYAVFFDVYGTLLVSSATGLHDSPIHKEALIQTLSLLTTESIPEEAINGFQNYIQFEYDQINTHSPLTAEINILNVWDKLLKDLNLTPNDLYSLEYITLYYECLTNPVWPMPELIHTIKSLRAKGIYLSIISNAQFYTPLILETLLNVNLEYLGFHSPGLMWSYEQQIAKPSPELFIKAYKAIPLSLNIRPENILFVGNDYIKDILPAQSVGFKTAFFAGDQRSLLLNNNSPQINLAEADITITHLSQLIHCIS